MSEYTESTVPYEFLVRWDQSGNLTAAHVGFRRVARLDGAVVADVALPVQPVAVGLSEGFPLADILDQTLIDALARISVLEANPTNTPAPPAPSVSIPRWKGRAYLAALPAATEGPLAAMSGATMLAQVDAYMLATLIPAQYERYVGTETWERADPMITGMAQLLGLSDSEVDAWFAAAGAFV